MINRSTILAVSLCTITAVVGGAAGGYLGTLAAQSETEVNERPTEMVVSIEGKYPGIVYCGGEQAKILASQEADVIEGETHHYRISGLDDCKDIRVRTASQIEGIKYTAKAEGSGV